MKPVIVVGHAAWDRVYRIAAFPPEPTKVRALEHIEGGGGMAANAAAAIARLGGAVQLWTRIGADEAGIKIRASLEAACIDTRGVRTMPGARSSTTAIIVDGDGERLIVGERDHGMSPDASWLPLEDIQHAGAVLSDFNWVEAASAAFIAARSAGVVTVLDADVGAGGRLDAILPLTDYAIFSAAALAAYAPEGTVEEQLAAVLKQSSVKHAGVTLGTSGYHWISRHGGTGHQPAFALDAVDTTGAGDAFHGAFAWALAQSRPEEEAARFAAAVAALKCRKLGARAGLPTLGEVERFLAEMGG